MAELAHRFREAQFHGQDGAALRGRSAGLHGQDRTALGVGFAGLHGPARATLGKCRVVPWPSLVGLHG
ncbi:hypothetical protein PAHAL_9G346200 [Panicum hallii]|uniref:Uncharacterized protein n=1 Tax=Panicum hallii TaxID=206008 RepID=A0A2T8I3F6_9POAL|nr:hypothetical protein PAHAL_9G346200 [Panicum hallii]